MNRRTFFIGIALFVLVFVPPVSEGPDQILTEENLLGLVNQDRTAAGLFPLHPSVKLARAAEDKARHMLKSQYFAHVSPAGLEPWSFIKNAGFNYAFAGENLAINYTNPYELEGDFLQSPSHRQNLLSSLFTEVGIAIVSGKYRGKPAVMTVLMFGADGSAGQIARTN